MDTQWELLQPSTPTPKAVQAFLQANFSTWAEARTVHIYQSLSDKSIFRVKIYGRLMDGETERSGEDYVWFAEASENGGSRDLANRRGGPGGPLDLLKSDGADAAWVMWADSMM